MAPEIDEIRRRLGVFAAKWSVYEGTEKSEAQTFLNQLFECYGQNREDVASFEEAQQGRFLDLIWPEVCIFEMKAPKEAQRLEKHRKQALDYWHNSADVEAGIQAPEFVVLCAFKKLEIWQPGKYPNAPRLTVDLIELEERPEALMFLAGAEPEFAGGQADLTRDAVVRLAELYKSLRERRAAPPLDMRNFILQCVWCMFAEDLKQLDGNMFSKIVGELIASKGKRSSADDLSRLFEILNDDSRARPSAGMYAGAPYVNGGLFEEPARVHLEQHELEMLAEVAASNWSQVEPSIFGSLLETGLGHDNQWKLGAHYTHVADIQKIVQPTIVRPWAERIESIETLDEAVSAQNDLMNYVVLDPACGSGNFLYVAYREIKRLERRLHEREAELRKAAGLQPGQAAMSFYPLSNIRGIELEPFAVALARVTLWMGHKLSVDELGLNERTLPLADLSGIRQADALRCEWPTADAIIGNPPFHGAGNLRGVLGDDYVEWLRKTFNCGVKDLCVYWFRKAAEGMTPGQRAGLVATNSVSQNLGRSASLDYLLEKGGVITEAVSTQVWPGEANVHVSIVNWRNGAAPSGVLPILNGEPVERISSSLRAEDEPAPVKALAKNRGRCFEGPSPKSPGFIITPTEASLLLERKDADYARVVRPYLTARDIANDPKQAASRWAIDFGMMPLEDAQRFPAALEIVEFRVKPDRLGKKRAAYRKNWWRFDRPRAELRSALAPLDRFIACPGHAKRVFFVWCDSWVCASNATDVFAFSDDYSMGVLSSSTHTEWARARSSTLKGDIRYTPTTAFATFPWPQASDSQRAEISALSIELHALRSQLCSTHELGLTKLYNSVDDGAFEELRAVHLSLDRAVAAAYGWPKSIAQDPTETNPRLQELNRQIAEGEIEYAPFE